MPLFLLLFASANFVMPRSSPASFSYELTRTDSLYFTVTTFQHGGLRRYHGDQPDRQACGHRPNDLRPACPGLGHSRVPWGRAMGATGAARHHRSGNLTNDAADHCASWRPSPALRIGDSIKRSSRVVPSQARASLGRPRPSSRQSRTSHRGASRSAYVCDPAARDRWRSVSLSSGSC